MAAEAEDWRRVLVCAQSDWKGPSLLMARKSARCQTREAFVRARERKRSALARFARQNNHLACAAPEISLIIAYAVAELVDAGRAAAVSREWRLATRNWLAGLESAPLWRWLVGELCPGGGASTAVASPRATLLRWLEFPMAVGEIAGWLRRERTGLYREPCATQYELATSLAAVFAFLANTGERGSGGTHRWRAPRFLGFDRLGFEPVLDGGALSRDRDDDAVAVVVDCLQAFGVWLARDPSEAGRVVADCVERTFRRTVRFLRLARPEPDGGAWAVDGARRAVFAAFLRDFAPLFPQAADARPGDPVTVTRRLLPCPWNDLLVPDVLAHRSWRFSSARRSASGAYWSAAWQAR